MSSFRRYLGAFPLYKFHDRPQVSNPRHPRRPRESSQSSHMEGWKDVPCASVSTHTRPTWAMRSPPKATRHSTSLAVLARDRVIFVMALAIFPGYIEKWLWMESSTTSTSSDTPVARWGMFLFAFVVAFLFLWINLRQAAVSSADYSVASGENARLLSK